MAESSSNPDISCTMPTRSEFDEDGYLLLHPDVAAAVARGIVGSGWQHFSIHGNVEGRRWLVKVDPLLGVSRELAPGDGMYFGDEAHYFDVGESALHAIETALGAARRPKSTVRRILDLPCGHGRVMRFLRKAFPAAELTACDLDRGGVAFCAEHFGAVPVVSHVEPAEIPLAGAYDLIWCGSLLTHLARDKWRAFLEVFHQRLQPGGMLVFTSHGRHCEPELTAGKNRFDLNERQVAQLLAGYRGTGFGFVDYLDQPGYGFSLVAPEFVMAQFLRHPPWQLHGYHENGWDKRQDVISLRRSGN